MQRSFIFLADGFEEIEAITPIDVMRRAGMDIKSVSIGNRNVTGAHGVTIAADLTFDQADFSNAEWLIIPGGLPGAENLRDFAPLGDLLKSHAPKGKIAAICAAPAMVLAPLGLLKDKEATGYPGTEAGLRAGGAIVRDVPVMALDDIVTANGPSSAMRFALTIVASSLGESVAQQIGGGMLYYPRSTNFYF